VFSGLFFNGAESWRDLAFYKNVVEICAFNESVKPWRNGGDRIVAGLTGDRTIVL
jgi:hypothetical protein